MGKSLENVHTKYDRIFIQWGCSLSNSSPISARGVSFSKGSWRGGGSVLPPPFFRGVHIVGVNPGAPSSGTFIPFGAASGGPLRPLPQGRFKKIEQ